MNTLVLVNRRGGIAGLIDCACGTDADRRAGVVLGASFFIDGNLHHSVLLPL
uniref:hypothetical protein n=1 Tax=Candidatus Desulfosporosinus nitrosoreducens TaxID=3401928 RepID=UPI00280BF137|nr:hypothetical protein [Desulfosporosinus sp. PR]